MERSRRHPAREFTTSFGMRKILTARRDAFEGAEPTSHSDGHWRVRYAFAGAPVRTRMYRSQADAETAFHAVRLKARSIGLDVLRLEEASPSAPGLWRERSRGAPRPGPERR